MPDARRREVREEARVLPVGDVGQDQVRHVGEDRLDRLGRLRRRRREQRPKRSRLHGWEHGVALDAREVVGEQVHSAVGARAELLDGHVREPRGLCGRSRPRVNGCRARRGSAVAGSDRLQVDRADLAGPAALRAHDGRRNGPEGELLDHGGLAGVEAGAGDPDAVADREIGPADGGAGVDRDGVRRVVGGFGPRRALRLGAGGVRRPCACGPALGLPRRIRHRSSLAELPEARSGAVYEAESSRRRMRRAAACAGWLGWARTLGGACPGDRLSPSPRSVLRS